MRKLKRFFPAVILAAVLIMTGCRQSADENEGRSYSEQEENSGAVLPSADQNVSGQTDSGDVLPEDGNSEDSQKEDETSSFLFRLSTSYVTRDEDFNGGPVISGTMKTGDKAVLVKSDSVSYEAKIERMAQYRSDDDGEPTPVDEAEEGSFVYVWLEKNTSYDWHDQPLWHRPDELQYGDILLGIKQWEYGIEMEFPFEESEEYTLAFAPQEKEKTQGEFRLYDGDGAVLQQIPYGAYEWPYYFILHRDDRNSLVFYSDEEEKKVKCLEWNDGQFSESEIDIKPDMTITEETEKRLVRERYGLQGESRKLERTCCYTLQKDTGKLEIWSDVAGESIFSGVVELDKGGNPVNQAYYDFLFWDDLYDLSDECDPKVHMDLEYEDGEWHDVSYESKEAFLAEFGVENSTPRYESYDRYHNFHIELYEDGSGKRLCGIIYKMDNVNSQKEKWAYMYGFTIDVEGTEKEKWSDNTYSIMSEIGPDDEKGYEETVEYTPDGKPVYFESRGLAEVNNGSGIEEELIPLVRVSYIYRDDGTLFYRHYGHSTYLYATNDSSLSSFYDEKERIVYEKGYITSGDQEYYYIYADDGNVPECKLDVLYIHGGISVWPAWYG